MANELFTSESFSRMLVRAMGLKGWTQQDLATESGISQPTIHRYIKGKTEPKVADLMRLSGAFGMSLDALVGNGPATSTITTEDAARWRDRAREAEQKVEFLKAGMQGLLKKI